MVREAPIHIGIDHHVMPRQARRQISRHTEDFPFTLLRLGMQEAQKKLGLRQLLSPAPSHYHPRNRISVSIDSPEHLTQLFKLS